MKVISPGVMALRPFRVVCYELSQEMVDWWVMMGAEAQEIADPYYSHRSGHKMHKYYRIRMPGVGAKWSHKFNDDSGTYMLHMKEEFAPEASLFILKWPDNIINHDIRIPKNDYEEQTY